MQHANFNIVFHKVCMMVFLYLFACFLFTTGLKEILAA